MATTDPKFPTAKWLMGYKGNSFLDVGYVSIPATPMLTAIMHDTLDGECICNNEHKGFEMIKAMIDHFNKETDGFLVKLEENRHADEKYFKFDIAWIRLESGKYRHGQIRICLKHNNIKLLKHYTLVPSRPPYIGETGKDRSEWDSVMECDLNSPNSIQDLTDKILELKKYVFK